MLATHDSLTGYPVKYFLLKPFNFMAQCQSKNLVAQFDAGARSFDLRFAKHRGKWHAAHGAMLYKVTLEESLNILMKLSKVEPLYFRILCEDSFYRKSNHKELYNTIVNYLSDKRHNLKLLYVASKRKWDWITTEFTNATENYDVWPPLKNTAENLCQLTVRMYELETTNDKVNFICCYNCAGIPWLFGLPFPKVVAKTLTPIALKKKWKDNDCPVVDFI